MSGSDREDGPAPDATAADVEKPDALVLMTMDEYQASYLRVHGKLTPEDLSELLASPVPRFIRTRTAEAAEQPPGE